MLQIVAPKHALKMYLPKIRGLEWHGELKKFVNEEDK